MDIIKARERARKADFGVRVDAFAATHFAELALPQDRQQRYDPGCLSQLRESGLLSLELGDYLPDSSPRPALLPENGSFADVVTAIRMLARTDPAIAVFVHVHNALAVRCLIRYGTDQQKALWLPQLARDSVGAFAATEPHAGSDLAKIRTTVTRSRGKLVLNGCKHWITNAVEADLFITIAMLDGHVAALIVPAAAPGVEIGERLSKMSMRASSTCTVTFSDVMLDEESSLLIGSGLDVTMYGLVHGRIGVAAQMLGLAEGAHRRAIAYAREREAFGSRILEYQGISFPLAQLAAEITALDLMVREAGVKLTGRRSHMAAMDMANKAKLIAGQVAERAASLAVETLGGNGVAEAYEVEKFYRDAKVGRIYEGTENILLLALTHGLGKGRS